MSMPDEQQKNIRANMDLAETTRRGDRHASGNDIAVAVAEYARLSGITNIVIGKSRNKKMFKNLFETDLEDRLISLLPSIEVHIIPSPARQGEAIGCPGRACAGGGFTSHGLTARRPWASSRRRRLSSDCS